VGAGRGRGGERGWGGCGGWVGKGQEGRERGGWTQATPEPYFVERIRYSYIIPVAPLY
jgi:hypothetical protein